MNIHIEDLRKAVELRKARQTKYIKRLPKPGGKGYIYFYNQQQVKDYKEKGVLPSDKKEKGGLLSGIMSFFGLKDEKSVDKKVSEEYGKHKSKLGDITKEVFGNYLNEYLTKKDKWDKKLFGESKKVKAGKKEVELKKEKKTKGTVTNKSGRKFSLSIMRKIAGIYGDEKKSGEDNFETMPEGKSKKITTSKLLDIDSLGYTAAKAESGGEIRADEKKASLYAKRIYDELDKRGVTTLTDKIHEDLEDENAHTLNLVLSLGGYFGEDKQHKMLEFVNKMREQGNPEYGFPISAIPPEKLFPDEKEDKSSVMSEKGKSEDNFETMPEIERTEEKTPAKELKETIKKGPSKKMTDEEKNNATLTEHSFNKKYIFLEDPDEVAKNFMMPTESRAIGDIDVFQKSMGAFLSDEAKEKGFFSNSRFLINDKDVSGKYIDSIREKLSKNKNINPKFYENVEKRALDVTNDTILGNIKTKQEDYKNPKYLGGQISTDKSNKFGNKMMFENSDGDLLILNGDYYAFMRKEFPNATFKIKGSTDPTIFEENGEIKGVVMPIYGGTSYDQLEEMKHYKELHEKGRTDSAVKKDMENLTKETGIYSMKNFLEADGSVTQKKKNYPKEIKLQKNKLQGKEKEVLNKLKVKSVIKVDPIKPAFSYSKEGQDKGTWSNGVIIINDKSLSDKIYDTNNQNAVINKYKERGLKSTISDNTDEKATAEVKEALGERMQGAVDEIKEQAENYGFPNVDRIMNIEKGYEGEISGYVDDPDNPHVEYSSSTGEKVFLDGNQFATLRSMFPKAKVIFSEKEPQSNPVFLMEGKEIKGVIQPVVDRDNKWSEKVKKV